MRFFFALTSAGQPADSSENYQRHFAHIDPVKAT
jgi:hypothetical protein